LFLFTKAFWSYSSERAVKTVAQSGLAALTVAGISGILDVAWVQIGSIAALAGVVSLLTSVVGYERPKRTDVQ